MMPIRKATLIEKHAALVYDLRQRINPAYADQRGTESYERRECAEAIEELIAALEQAQDDLNKVASERDSFWCELDALQAKNQVLLDALKVKCSDWDCRDRAKKAIAQVEESK